MTTPICLLLSMVFEPGGLEAASREPLQLAGLVALLTLGVMGINVAEFGIVQWTSAVTFNVLSQLHSIPLVLAGVMFFGEHLSGIQVLGFCICLLGALLYSFIKAQEKRMPRPPFGGGGEQAGGTVMEFQGPFTRAPEEIVRRQVFS